jgi:hypothetical protein
MNWEGLCTLEKNLCYFCKKSIVIYTSKDYLPSLWVAAMTPTILISSKLWVGVDGINDDLSKIVWTCLSLLVHCGALFKVWSFSNCHENILGPRSISTSINFLKERLIPNLYSVLQLKKLLCTLRFKVMLVLCFIFHLPVHLFVCGMSNLISHCLQQVLLQLGASKRCVVDVAASSCWLFKVL